MKVLAIANQKGGVGKSTLAVNLGLVLVAQGVRVLLVDADPQGSAALWAAARNEELPRFDTMQLSKPILHRELPRIGTGYDLILIDVGGRDSATFRSALVAANEVLIPLGPGAADLWASQDVFAMLDEVAMGRSMNAWAVFTRVVQGTRIAKESGQHLNELLEEHDVALAQNIMHSRVAWAESFGEGLGVTEHPRGAAAAIELHALAEEIGLTRGDEDEA